MQDKKLGVKDLVDLEKVQSILNNELRQLEDRFVAVAMNYQYYLDSTWKANDIFKLRNNLTYRVSVIHYHLELLVLQEQSNKVRMESRVRSNRPDALVDSRENLIFGLYDSIIFHVCSLWDYLATITYFILGTKKPIKWSGLIKSVRDKNNPLSTSMLAELLIGIDDDLLKDLYGYRSLIIHETAELGGAPVTYQVMSATVTPEYYTTARHNKRIKHFKPLSEEYHISVKYAAYWIMFESIRKLTDLLFRLNDYMIANQKVTKPFMIIQGKDGTHGPVSPRYWNKKNYPDKPTSELGIF